MIELPEARIIARQMSEELQGKRITSAVHGESPHKFAFSNRPSGEYDEIMAGERVGEVIGHGPAILMAIGQDRILVLGGGGERILFHTSESTLPRKHQLLLAFEDGTSLSVTVQGWGNVLLLDRSELSEHPHVGQGRVTPLSEAFTLEHFLGLLDQVGAEDKRSVKYFLISEPGVWGIGNGYLQDILFRARIHPRRRAAELDTEESRALYDSIVETLGLAVDLGGRDTERDLYGRPGGYRRILHSKITGEPCPACGAPVEKIHYLGGASYFCPRCQR